MTQKKQKSSKRLRVGAAAEYMGLSPHVVRGLIHSGKLRALRVGYYFLIEPRDIDDYIRRAETVARQS